MKKYISSLPNYIFQKYKKNSHGGFASSMPGGGGGGGGAAGGGGGGGGAGVFAGIAGGKGGLVNVGGICDSEYVIQTGKLRTGQVYKSVFSRFWSHQFHCTILTTHNSATKNVSLIRTTVRNTQTNNCRHDTVFINSDINESSQI